jgi:hypothetical protein
VPEVREGTPAGGLSYIAFGKELLLIVFRGLEFLITNPTGILRRQDPKVHLLSPLARGGLTIYAVNRPLGLRVGTTGVADLAADHDRALETEFARPNDILSISKEALFAYPEAH